MMARLDFAKSYEDTAKRAKSLCVFVGLRGLIDFPKAGDLKTRWNLSVCADKSHAPHTAVCLKAPYYSYYVLQLQNLAGNSPYLLLLLVPLFSEMPARASSSGNQPLVISQG